MIQRILVVCVGNICRSPMAEALLRDQLSGEGVKVESAGLEALVDDAADPMACEIAADAGLDLRGHRARQVTEPMLQDSDLVLVMEAQHRGNICERFPHVTGKVHLLGRWGNFEVPDPYRGTRADFLRAFALIQRGVRDWGSRIGGQ